MLPSQRLTTKERETVDQTTGLTPMEQTVYHYAREVDYSADQLEMTNLYNAIEGILNYDDYDYILNPLNIKNTANLKYNSRLRNYNILRGIANLMIGEFGRRNHEYSVTDLNPEDESNYKKGLTEAMRNYYAQLAVNTLNEQGMKTGVPSQELPDIEEYKENFKRSYDQNRVISGQESLDYIRFEQEIDHKILDMYWDWLVVGRCVSYKGIRYDDVDYEYVPAREYHFPLEKHSRFGEDYSYGVRKRKLPLSKIIDWHREDLKEEDLIRLEKAADDLTLATNTNFTVPTGNKGFMYLPTQYNSNSQVAGALQNVGEGLDYCHVVWKGQKKIGILKYIDPLTGNVEEMEVNDTYVKNEEAGDISIEWQWITQVFEGTLIEEDIFCCVRELEYDRAELNNKSAQKLPYNVIQMRSDTGSIHSIIKYGVPYQIIINGLHFQLEKILNKNKDKLTVMPYGLVPRKKGMNTKQQMYHADTTSILWVDETAPNAQIAGQMIKTLDMSLSGYINDTIEIMKYIKSEYWEEIGMNPQRYSDIAQSAGKGTTEQAIERSSLITYEMNLQVDKFLEKDYKGLLDISKLAWINGKKAKYVRTDGSKAFINLNADDAIHHLETDYSIFVRDADEMTQALEQYRSLALAFAQNGGGMAGMAELFTNNNMEKLKDIVARIEENNRKHDEVIKENEHKRRMDELAKAEETAQADRQVKIDVAQTNKEAVIEAAQIRVDGQDNTKEDSEVDKLLADHKVDIENKELALKQKELTLNKNKKDER